MTSNVPRAPVYVVGDEGQLYRLVSNLIVNAIQYTPAGGEVSVMLTANNLQAVIQVQDTGIGIAPEEQMRIFVREACAQRNRFYRVNSDRSRNTGGSGLGLAIAKRCCEAQIATAIVQAHHGSLQVQSELSELGELGKGSTFTIQLPLVVGWAPPT